MNLCEFEASLLYTVRLCLKIKNNYSHYQQPNEKKKQQKKKTRSVGQLGLVGIGGQDHGE